MSARSINDTYVRDYKRVDSVYVCFSLPMRDEIDSKIIIMS